MANCHSRRCAPLAAQFVSLLLWEGHSPTHVAEQAGHSVATLASHCAGVLRELGDEPRIRAADAIRAARAELKRAQNVRRAPKHSDQRGATDLGDVGLEPTTSALSRRISVVKP